MPAYSETFKMAREHIYVFQGLLKYTVAKPADNFVMLCKMVMLFGERFLIYTPVYKRCAQATTNDIQHTQDCNFNDLRRVWLWTPGNLLMNADTSTCLKTKNMGRNYLPMVLEQCSSSDLGQKWRCEKRRSLWGISFDSPNITHAARYYTEKDINVRSVNVTVNDGNTWTVFPTNNESSCSAS